MSRLRWALVPLLVVPLAWLLGSGFGVDPRALDSPLVGRPAPSFRLVGIDGATLAAADLRGRPALVNFWASWCVPACVDEHPILLEAAERQPDGLQVVGVLYQDRVDDARGFLARYGDGGWPNLIDPDGRLALEFGVTGPPESFLIDAEGVVRGKHSGPLTAADLDALLEALP